MLYVCIIILAYHPEMLYVPVCRTTTTAVHSTVVFCSFRISRPAVPGTRHDTTRVSTSTPNENADHEELQLALDGCWRRLGNTWVVRVVVLWWCSGIPRCYEEVEVSVVPSGPGSAAAHPTTEPRQKKTRVSKKWNTLYENPLREARLL